MYFQYNVQKPPSSRFTLMSLYRRAIKQIKDDDDEDDDDMNNTYARISPEGNIYRVNALEAEHLKHRYDLQEQIAELSEEKQELLNDALKKSNKAPSHEARCQLLTSLLCKAKVHDEKKGEEEGSTTSYGFVPMKEFLATGGVGRYWYLGGMLLPKQKRNFRRHLKNRILGILIACIQIFGPIMIFIRNWLEPTNYLRAPGGFSKYFSWREITCFGNFSDFATGCLGTLFLYIVYEVARGYAFTELSQMGQSRHLPTDWFWKCFGEICNQSAIVFTCLAMPLVFWGELAPKDIVFDSLALLFVFSLDDLSGGALDYLNLSNEDFCKMRSCVTIFLGQCPIKLKDILNPDAKLPEELWKVKFGTATEGDRKGSFGLLTAKGELCKTRLYEVPDEVIRRKSQSAAEQMLTEATEATPLLKEDLEAYEGGEEEDDEDESPFESTHFVYTVDRNKEPQKLPGDGALTWLCHCGWYAVCYGVVIVEICAPPVFLVTNDPCYS